MPPPTDTPGPLKLRPTSSPFGALGAVLFVALFWNGLVSVFVWQDVVTWGKGGPEVFLALFLIPFVLIGLLLIYGVVRQVLLLFNPRSHLTLTPGVLAPGGAATVQWRLGSGGEGVRRVTVTCEGTRKMPSRNGRGNQPAAKPPFYTQVVVDTREPFEIASGGIASFALPADAPPSGEGLPWVVWSLRVRTEIRFWPDGDDEFPIQVQPAPGG
jgi:hypothetical protein